MQNSPILCPKLGGFVVAVDAYLMQGQVQGFWGCDGVHMEVEPCHSGYNSLNERESTIVGRCIWMIGLVSGLKCQRVCT